MRFLSAAPASGSCAGSKRSRVSCVRSRAGLGGDAAGARPAHTPGFTLPATYLIRDGWMKWIIRKGMDGRLPDEVTWRRQKLGFPFPISQWLDRNNGRLIAMVRPVDCPWIDADTYWNRFDELRQLHPNYPWCLAALALWWQRCVRDESLG